MTNYQSIRVTTENRVATLTLARPDAANGLNLNMATELALAAKEIAANSELKAAVLTGEGRFFCAGGDVKAMYDAEQNPGAAVRKIADQLHKALAIFARMDIPLICAINGTAAGAGFSLAVAGDMVVAAESAKFTMAYSNIGLSPDGSSSYYLPRLIGLRKTQELMFTNRVLSAEEALNWGLINQTAPDAELPAAVDALAQKFVSGSRSSNSAIKKLLLASANSTLEAQLELESDTIEQCANATDGREGVKSFIEKRKPEFD